MEDEDMKDYNRPTEETYTIERGSLSHHATHSHPDRIVYTAQHGASPSASHHETPSPPVHVLPTQRGTIPSSSRHSTPSPPGFVYPHEHGIRLSSSHHATPSPSAHPAHSPGIGNEHTFTSRPAPRRTSSARSSTNKLRSSIPHVVEEIPYFSDRQQLLQKAKILLFISLLSMACVLHLGVANAIYLITKKRITPIYLTYEVFEHYKRKQATDETFKKSEQISANKKSEVGGQALAKLTRRLEEMSAQSPDTLIDEDKIYLEGKQAHLEDQRMDLMSWKSSSRTTRAYAASATTASATVIGSVAFGIGVAYKEGVDKTSLFLLATDVCHKSVTEQQHNTYSVAGVHQQQRIYQQPLSVPDLLQSGLATKSYKLNIILVRC
ncbi:hypothetical protein Syun_011771 [Stephania yunnanensis]|uniref:Uncharacterized protein n=1 Tax=Stephania yunnanensis TaxID=152371 RepID=A0AAP0JY70_9MAGN